MNVVIVDDEAPARHLLAELLAEIGGVEIVGQAASSAEAQAVLRRVRPQVLFLDIQMPGGGGLAVAEAVLAQPDPPSIVFVTAYDEHAVRAFELGATDYLLKPVEPSRLRRTLLRLERLKPPVQALRDVLQSLRQGGPERLALLDEASGVRHLVDLADIAWFTSEDEKTYAHTGRMVLRSMDTLAALESKLPRDRFVRTHRSYIVNIGRVQEVVPWASGGYDLRLQGVPREIPLSRSYAAEFKARTGWI